MEKRGDKLNLKWIMGVVVIAFFLIFIFIRFSWVQEHFTHYDDIKVDQFTDYHVDVFELKFGSLAAKGTPFKQIYHVLHSCAGRLFNCVEYAINFSKYWHYAPLQYILTFALLPLATSYEGVKFWGRFPSLLLGIVALFACWKLVKKITKSNEVALFAAALLGFSWQSIIYCMNMGNYESIIFLGFAAGLLTIRMNDKHSLRTNCLCAMILGAMSWMQYQVVCLFGGFALACLIKYFYEKTKLKKIIVYIIMICISYAIVVLPLLTFAYMEGGPTWNVGPNGEYLFHFSFDLIYILKFFFVNSYKVIKALLSPVPLDSHMANLFAIVFVVLFVTGIIGSIKERKQQCSRFYVSVFAIGIFLTEYFFVFLGKFTLSPTRHNNVLIPVYVIEISLGLYYVVRAITEKWKSNSRIEYIKVLPVFLCICIAVCFGLHYEEVKAERQDLFTAETVNEMIDEHRPDIVIDCTAPQMWYLLGEEYQRKEIIDYQTDFYDLDDDLSNNRKIMIVSHTKPIDHDILEYVKDALVEKNYLSEQDVTKLLQSNPVATFEKAGDEDFDFYNVTTGASNGMFYAVYNLDAQ